MNGPRHQPSNSEAHQPPTSNQGPINRERDEQINKLHHSRGPSTENNNTDETPIPTYEEAEDEIDQPEIDSTQEEVTHTPNTVSTNKQSTSPYLQCYVEGEPVRLLIDKGATISVLTKEVVDVLLRKNPKIPALPVSGVQISNAVGKKICKISKQIWSACRISNTNIYANFIQIENLNEQGIIGADVLNKYHAQIDFEREVIRWTVDDEIHFTEFARKETLPQQTGEQIHDIGAIEDHVDNIELKEEENNSLTIY